MKSSIKITKTTLILFIASMLSYQTTITSALLGSLYNWFSDINQNIVMLLYTLPSLLGGLCPIILSPFMSKINKKGFIIFGLSSIVVGGVITLLLAKGSFVIALISLSLIGIGQSTVMAGTNTMLTESDPANANRLISFNQSAGTLGQMIVGIISGYLAADGDWTKGFIVCLPAIIAIVLVIALGRNEAKVKNSAENSVTDQSASKLKPLGKNVFICLVIIEFLAMTSNAAWYANYSDYIINETKIGTTIDTGILMTVGTLGGVIGGVAFSTLFNKLFKNWSMSVLIILICAPNVAALLGSKSMTVFYITMFMMMGFYTPLFGEISATSARTSSNATTFMAGWHGTAGFLAPYLLNLIVSLGGGDFRLKFVTAIVCVILGCILSIYVVKAKNKADADLS